MLPIGAAAVTAKRRWAYSTAVAIVPAAYSRIWGTKKRSRNGDERLLSACTSGGASEVSSSASHGAPSTPTTVTAPEPDEGDAEHAAGDLLGPGSSPAGRAASTNVGTSTADSAPAASSSNSTFETELAGWKALPR